MTVNHIAMFVSDLEASKAFFERYFGAVANSKYHNPKTGLQTYFLSFDGAVRIELMHRPDCISCDSSGCMLGLAHIAFSVGSREKVDSLTAQLEGDGFTVLSPPRTTGDGYYESLILDNDGNKIEITE